MNKEMADRIREAGNYQKKAIHALFPDRTNRHLEVIEHEIREMLTEEAEVAGENSEELLVEVEAELTDDVEVETSIFLKEDEETEGFLPEVEVTEVDEMLADDDKVSVNLLVGIVRNFNSDILLI